jgi:hypothetical protein
MNTTGLSGTGDLSADTIPTAGDLGLPLAASAAGAAAKSQTVSLTSQEVSLVSAMSRHYRKQFGQRMDVEEFVANHLYARIVLQQAHESGNAELAALAAHFLDERGIPRLHRGRSDVDIEF